MHTCRYMPTSTRCMRCTRVNIQTDRRTDRQTDRHANYMHSHMKTYTLCLEAQQVHRPLQYCMQYYHCISSMQVHTKGMHTYWNLRKFTISQTTNAHATNQETLGEFNLKEWSSSTSGWWVIAIHNPGLATTSHSSAEYKTDQKGRGETRKWRILQTQLQRTIGTFKISTTNIPVFVFSSNWPQLAPFSTIYKYL